MPKGTDGSALQLISSGGCPAGYGCGWRSAGTWTLVHCIIHQPCGCVKVNEIEYTRNEQFLTVGQWVYNLDCRLLSAVIIAS